MTRMFLKIYDFLSTRRTLMWILLAGTVLLSLLSALRISLKEDISDFLPSDSRNRDMVWALSKVTSDNRVVVCISPSENAADCDEYMLMDAVDTLEQTIMRYVPAEYVKSAVMHTDDAGVREVTDFIVDNLPYYLTDREYARLDSLLECGSLDNELESARSLTLSPAGGFLRGIVAGDPLMLSAARFGELRNFSSGSSFHSVEDYLFTKDGAAIATLDLAFGSSDTGRASDFIKAMDSAVNATEAAFGGNVSIDVLGSAYIADTNASRIKKDTLLSVAIAVLLIAVLLISFFRKGGSILLVGATILYGFVTAFGAVALIKGSMSLIVIGMGAVIIGIAANYPLHFLTHVNQGYSPRESLSDIVLPLTTGNITTVGAFLSLLFIASDAMRDLGLFAALLLVGTIVFTLVFLPHLVPEHSVERQPARAWDTFTGIGLSSSRIAVIVVVVLTVFFSFFDDRVKFDSDLHNINYMTDRQKAGMGRMLELAQGSDNVTYVVIDGADKDEAICNYLKYASRIDSLSNLGDDVKVSALHDFVPDSSLQRARLDRWNAFVAADGARLLSMVESSARKAGFVDGAFAPFEEMLGKNFEVRDASYFDVISTNIAAGKFIGDNGRCAVVTTVGSRDNLTAAVSAALQDTPAIVFDASSMTGRMVESLSAEFDTVLYICAFVVFVLLLISFGRLELAATAFLPLTVGWIWILGMMGLVGIDFNIINVILATFIFGMGDDYTIFITEGVMYEYAYGRKMLRTYERTIILSALIMFVGIGSLVVARHPAMRSLSHVTMIGMFSVVLMADIIPPFIFRLLTVKKGRKRTEPLTIVNFLSTVAAFAVFLVGSLVITVAGFFLITLTFHSKKGKYLYHCLLCAVSRFVFNNVFFTKHTVECGERFDKPAVIVANHQSHLDLMALLMLNPKIVAVTNKWVWNNPLYGLLIRYAGFCPIDNVLTDDLSALRKKVEDGYSILVFPEGTRTPDGSIGRFHKGAFHIAEMFSLDIVPVVLHGLNDVLPKQDLLLRSGHMTVKVLPRIPYGDNTFGTDSRERAKGVRRMMASVLEDVARRRETVEYYRDRVIHNYIYKGADVERTVRESLRKNGCYADLAGSLPEGGRVLFVNPSLGEPALICALARKDVEIEAVFDDEMTSLLAACCAGVPVNLRYISPSEVSDNYDKTVRF